MKKMFITSSRGITFIELMTILIIIGVASAFAIPNITRALPKYRLKAAARSVAGMVQQARLKAVKSGMIQFLMIDFGNIAPMPIAPNPGPPISFTDDGGNAVPIGVGHTNLPANAGQVRIIQDDFPAAQPLIGDFTSGDAIPTGVGNYNPYPSANWPFIVCCQNDVTVDPECVNLGGPFCNGTDSLSPYDMLDITALPGSDDFRNVIISQVTDANGNNFPLPQFAGAQVGNGPAIAFGTKGFSCSVGDVPLGGVSCNPQQIQSITAIIMLQETIGGAKAVVTVFGSGGYAVEMVGQDVL